MNLDSGSGAAIAANAKSQGVKVIDYDRLTLKGDSDYYVSFDNEKVGKLQGQGLVDCLGDKKGAAVAELNGSPTDNNATLFKKGYDSVLQPKFDDGTYKKVADQSVPDWDNQKALTIFEQILQKQSNKIDGVLAANDGLGNAAISALKQRKLPQIGHGRTRRCRAQNIVSGDQCMTVSVGDDRPGRVLRAGDLEHGAGHDDDPLSWREAASRTSTRRWWRPS